jgi:hypothetical protein
VPAGAGEVARYALVFLWAIFCPKAILAARLLAAESQLVACKHEIASKKRLRPRFTPGFRLLWVVLSKCLDRWEDLAHLMQPATVKKWHTMAFRHFWRWKSGRKGGRPPISKQMQSQEQQPDDPTIPRPRCRLCLVVGRKGSREGSEPDPDAWHQEAACPQ